METTAPVADATPSPEDRLRQLEAEAAENLAGWQRARADYQNLKREWERKQGQFITDAKAMLLGDVLPSLDGLFRAVRGPRSGDAWAAGVAGIARQLEDFLIRWGVGRVPTVGQPFDPSVHEAVSGQGDTVVEEVEGGYRLDGRLLYPAKVVVGPVVTDGKPPDSPPSLVRSV